ncbi:hypothetical protein Xlen_03915 [Xanthomonas campestris pv. leeana]|nr:hypothetical protein Xths_06000 [Xanthomonas campestris pv. thespesiae]OOW76871.1 hypothetical protein Xlen_03915 [Xanthomonas campestris pv. leeana]
MGSFGARYRQLVCRLPVQSGLRGGAIGWPDSRKISNMTSMKCLLMQYLTAFSFCSSIGA